MATNPQNQADGGPDQEGLLSKVCPSAILQSPIPTWIADRAGTRVFMNAAAREFFGIKAGEVPPRYNIFEDEVLAEAGLIPRIRKVFEEGGSDESIVDYDSSRLRNTQLPRPFHKVIRTFLFAVKNESGEVENAVVQHDDVTDRINTQRALAEQEERFRVLNENATDLLVALGPDGVVRYASPSIEGLLGYTPEDVVGRNVLEFIHPDELEMARESLRGALASEDGHSVAHVRVRHKDGSWRHMESIASGWVGNPAIGGIVLNARDITERIQAEEALRRSEAEMRAVISAMSDVVLVLDSDGRYVRIEPTTPTNLLYKPPMELIGRTLHDVFPKWRADEFLGYVRQALNTHETVSCEYELEIDDRRVWFHAAISPMSQSEVLWVARDITAIKRAEAEQRRTADKLSSIVAASPMAIICLDLDGKVISWNPTAMQIFGWSADEVMGRPAPIIPEDEQHIYTEIISRLMNNETIKGIEFTALKKDGTEICASASMAPMHDGTGRVAGFVGLIADVTDRAHALRALQESESKFRTLAENAHAIIGIVQGTKFVYANPYLEQISGYTAEEILSIDIRQLLAPEFRDIVVERARRRQMGLAEPSHYEFKMVTKNGEEIWLDFSPALITYMGKPAIVGVAYDITERKHAEEALARSESNLRRMVKHAPASIITYDRNGIILSANKAFEKQLGYSADEIIGKPISDTFGRSETDRERSKHVLQRVFAGETVENLEATGVRPDGSIVYSIVSATPIFDDKGEVAMALAVGVDVTERKRIQQALEEAEAKYRNLVEQSLVGVYIIQDGRFIYVNPEEARILGYSRDELIGMPIIDTVAPEDRGLVEENLRKRLSGTVQSAHYAFKALRKDGRIIDVEVLGSRTVYQGKPAVVGTAVDITERKKSEDALRRSEENFRAIFDSMPAAVFSYDRNAVILQVNPAFQRLFGFAPEQAVGHSMFETIARPQDRELTFQVIEQVFSGKRVENIEWQDVRADGILVYVLSNTTPVYSPSGEIIYGMSMGIDITERKAAAQRASELEEHKREFYRCTILAATEGKLEITERQDILRIAGPPIAEWDIRNAEDLGKIRQEVGDIVRSAGMDDDRTCDFILATGEATTNAYKHAGGGTTSLHRVDGCLMLVVSDQGKGMEALALPELAFTRGYTTAKSLGMGYKAVLSVADKVYLATGPSGTTVAIEMSLSPVPKPVPVLSLPDTW